MTEKQALLNKLDAARAEINSTDLILQCAISDDYRKTCIAYKASLQRYINELTNKLTQYENKTEN